MKKTIARVVAAASLGVLVLGAPAGSAADRRAAAPAARSPVDLGVARFFLRRASDDDGHPLILRKLAVRVSTAPGVVRSHLTMEVTSARADEAEAVMRLPVPRGAAVTDAVLWVDGRPMNGVLAEERRATDAYQSIVFGRRDPALVTWAGPSWIAVSIFPVDRRHPRRFELGWVEPAAIAGGRVQYRVPVVAERGRLIARASMEVDGRPLEAGGQDVVAIAPASSDGDRPMVVGRAPGAPFQQLLLRTAAPSAPPRFVLLVETSAAMTTADRLRQRAAIDALLAALPPGSKATIAAADWNLFVAAEDADASLWPDALARIDGTVSAGALHLERALLDAGARARDTGAGAVLFVGRGRDGFAGDALRAPLPLLAAAGIRLSFIRVGRDDGLPAEIADAAALTGGEALPARALTQSLPSVVSALRPRPRPPALGPDTAGPWRALETILGQTVWVGQTVAPPREAAAPAAPAADLAALWDRARLGWSDATTPVGTAAPAVAVTPTTALLVLERQEDYGRFGIAAAEPAPIPTWSAPRDVAAAPPAPPAPRASPPSARAPAAPRAQMAPASRPARERAVAGRRLRAPDVIAGNCFVRGSLDKEIIRRIIRRHLNEVRFCYEEQLIRRPTLQGRVTLQLVIAPSGKVVRSSVQQSTVGDRQVEGCIVRVTRGWDFPMPLGGGDVVVTYPFVLLPAGGQLPPAFGDAEALAYLAGGGPLDERLRRIARGLDLGAMTDPAAIAWSIGSRAASLDRLLLVARLLDLAQRKYDAVRVLSERAAADPVPIAAELDRLGAPADAAQVRALASR